MVPIFICLTLASVVSAQVVNGMSTVLALGSSATAQPSSWSSTPGTGSYALSVALPPQYTPAPSSSATFYHQMPYESYKNGGYKSLDCGYGYKKSSDGHCQPESWVIFFSLTSNWHQFSYLSLCSIPRWEKDVTRPLSSTTCTRHNRCARILLTFSPVIRATTTATQ